MATEVVNIILRDYDIFIGRPSKWGNPFWVGKDGTRKEVVEKYEKWIREQPDLLASLAELRGKKLGCFCAPKLCHGSVLVSLLKELDINESLE